MLNDVVIQERVKHFPDRCRAAGLKLTHQRVAIYNLLAATESHPTPDEVYAGIRRDLPTISLATIYKVLDQFHRKGFLRRVSTENQVARYDANLSPHHHLVCDRCGRIQDVLASFALQDLPLPDREGFRVSYFDLIYHGLCRDCRDDRNAPII